MTLLQIRTQFLELSGRNDLDAAGTAIGMLKKADFFIQAGTRHLDLVQRTEWSTSRYSIDIVAGQSRIIVPEPRTILKVYMQNATDSITEADKLLYAEFRARYEKSMSAIDNGTPIYYTRAPHLLAPSQLALKATDYTGDYTYEYGDTVFADDTIPGTVGRYRSSVVLVGPPADQTITATIVGEFYSKILALNTDENYWSVQFPELLIKSSLRELEGFYRNTEGVKDWDNLMSPDLIGIEKDLVEQEAANVNVMGG